MTKKNKAELSQKEKIIFDFCLSYFEENKKMPSIREIGKNFNFSPIRASQILKELYQKKYLIKIEGRFHQPYLPAEKFLIKGQNQQINQ
jgi:DNA-binding transcriptional regulator YhcF (GntR family)